MTERWIFHDPTLDETWTMPINPNTMTSPWPEGTADYAYWGGRIRTFRKRSAPVEWSFGGVIRTQAHADALEQWAKKTTEIQITDHLGRTWEVILTGYAPEDRKPTPRVPWRLRYTMRSMVVKLL